MIPKDEEKMTVDEGVDSGAPLTICIEDHLNPTMYPIEEHVTTMEVKEVPLFTAQDDGRVNTMLMDESGRFHSQIDSGDANSLDSDGGTSDSELSDSTSSASKDAELKEIVEEVEENSDDDNNSEDTAEEGQIEFELGISSDDEVGGGNKDSFNSKNEVDGVDLKEGEEIEEDSDNDDNSEGIVEGGQIEFELGLSSDDEVGGGDKAPIKSKNEVDVLPPVSQVDVILEPHHQLLPVGIVSAIVGSKVIVDGLVKHSPLNEGSILWTTEAKSLLGRVDEIFGPVKNPYYIVRFNTDKDIPLGIQEGISVSFVSEFSDHIINEKALYKKGYDASGDNDEELDVEVEFSDDEKEAEYRRLQRQTKRVIGKSQTLNQEKTHVKKTQLKRSGFQKNNGRKVPTHNTTSMGNPTPCVSGKLAMPPTPVNFGSNVSATSSASSFAFGNGPRPPVIHPIPHAQQPGSFMGGQQQNLFQQQTAPAWALGIASAQHQNIGFMNGSNFQQLMNQQSLFNFQQQQQVFPGLPNGVMFQQNFGSNLGNPNNFYLNAPLNSSMGPNPMFFGAMGQNGFNQAPPGVSGMNSAAQFQLPLAPQGQIQNQMQFSMGTSSATGKPPHASNGRYPRGNNR